MFKIINSLDFLKLGRRFKGIYYVKIKNLIEYEKVLNKASKKKFNSIIILNLFEIEKIDKRRLKKINYEFIKKYYKIKDIYISTQRDLPVLIRKDDEYPNELIIDYKNFYTKHENFFIERKFDKTFDYNIFLPFFDFEKKSLKFLNNFELKLKINSNKNFKLQDLLYYLEFYEKIKKEVFISKKRLHFEYFPKNILFCKKYDFTKIYNSKFYYLIFYEDLRSKIYIDFTKKIVYPNFSVTIAPFEFLYAHYYILFEAKLKRNKNISYDLDFKNLLKCFIDYKKYLKKKKLNIDIFNFFIRLYKQRFNI